MANTDNQNDMLRMLGEKLGKSPDEIQSGIQSGNINGLLSKLSTEQKNKVNNLLSDPEATKKLLENPQVQALIKRFGSNG